MKIKSYKKAKNNCYEISFHDHEKIILFDDIILKYNLLIKKEINEKELAEILKENIKLKCYYQAIKYLSIKTRCKKEIKEYLIKNKYSKTEIDTTLKMLEEKHLIEEEKYIEAFLHDQIYLTSHGPQKIKRKLLELELPEEKINKFIDEIKEEIWQEKLQKIILKKINSNKKDGETKLKEKLLYHGINEGYSKESITNILENIEYPKNEKSLEKEARKLYEKLSKKYNEKELFYQIKGRLIRKGFLYSDIDRVIESIKKSSL